MFALAMFADVGDDGDDAHVSQRRNQIRGLILCFVRNLHSLFEFKLLLVSVCYAFMFLSFPCQLPILFPIGLISFALISVHSSCEIVASLVFWFALVSYEILYFHHTVKFILPCKPSKCSRV